MEKVDKFGSGAWSARYIHNRTGTKNNLFQTVYLMKTHRRFDGDDIILIEIKMITFERRHAHDQRTKFKEVILPHDPRARRLFVTSGGLRKVQEIQADPGSTLLEYIQIINCCFPEEIVRYYSPGYPSSLLEAVEQYQPKCPSLFAMEEHLPSDIDSKSSLSSFNEEG